MCNLNKTTNSLRASQTLAVDLLTHDIDIAVISESHLHSNIPDSVIGIDGYDIFKQDSDFGAKDKRNNGGIAIHIRQHLKVERVEPSESFELASLTVKLPSGHNMLIVGVYHQEASLTDTIIDTITDTSDKF